MTSEERTEFLLKYCQDKAPIYNKVSLIIYKLLGMNPAELSLICTYVLCEYLEGKDDR